MEEKEQEEYASGDIRRVELYLMFSTDLDFHVNLDGLETFIRSRLGDDALIYDFRAEDIRIGDYDDQQFIRLSVELPVYAHDIKEGSIPNSNSSFYPKSWAEDVVQEVLLPAYMWIFAEIGIGNHHNLSSYITMSLFDHFDDGTLVPIGHWLKSSFSDGVRLLPRMDIMSGNYEDSWAQFRFIMNGARDCGYSEDYVESVRMELEEKYGRD